MQTQATETASLWHRASLRQIILVMYAAAALPIAKYWLDGFAVTTWPMETSGFPVARDFANIWAAGKAALSGLYGPLFDALAHRAELARAIAPALAGDGPLLVWSYPPTAFWLGLPFAGLPYSAAVLGWLVAGLLAAAVATGASGRAWTWAILLGAPGVLIALFYGQTALLTAAVLIGGLRIADTRPILAGALLATLVAKPHLGLAVPIVLAATRNTRAFAATAAFSVLYLAATLLAFGLEPWRLFVSVTLPQQAAFFERLYFAVPEMVISPLVLFRKLGASMPLALALHAMTALAVCVATYLACRRTERPATRLVLASTATLLLSPYMQLYEFALIGVLAAALVGGSLPLGEAEREDLKGPLALLLYAPVVVLVLASTTSVNVAPVLLLTALALVAAPPLAGSSFKGHTRAA